MIFDEVVLEFRELVQKLTQPRRLSIAADYSLIWRWRTCYQVVHAGGKMRHYAFLFSDFFWLFQEAIVTYFSRKEHFDAWAVWCESRWRRFIFQLSFFWNGIPSVTYWRARYVLPALPCCLLHFTATVPSSRHRAHLVPISVTVIGRRGIEFEPVFCSYKVFNYVNITDLLNWNLKMWTGRIYQNFKFECWHRSLTL